MYSGQPLSLVRTCWISTLEVETLYASGTSSSSSDAVGSGHCSFGGSDHLMRGICDAEGHVSTSAVGSFSFGQTYEIGGKEALCDEVSY